MKKILLIIFIPILVLASVNNNVNVVDSILKDIKELNSTKIEVNDIKDYLINLKIKLDDNISSNKYTLTNYHQNYLTLFAYTPNKLVEKHYKDGVRDYQNDYYRKNTEANFQISIKVPMYKNFFNSKGDFYFAYTQNSYWQVYDKKHSSPFRETNYMPEVFLRWQKNNKIFILSLIHQSNGQDVGKSRSWNRTQFSFVSNHKNFIYGFDIWDRWDEDKKKDIKSTQGDDNPDLEKYIGKNKFFFRYKIKKLKFTLSHQNDITKYNINNGNTKFDFIFPSFNKNSQFFLYAFRGYGESLIDYDVKITRYGFGIMIADWNY